jgi:hypothetical protein
VVALDEPVPIDIRRGCAVNKVQKIRLGSGKFENPEETVVIRILGSLFQLEKIRSLLFVVLAGPHPAVNGF